MTDERRAFKRRLDWIYAGYTLAYVAFVVLLAVLERMGLSRLWIGTTFLVVTVGVYAGIGIASRTTDAREYFVAGRRVPAMYNGMAIAADWMSAASFIGLAGFLYLRGYGGLAYVLGGVGGFCLMALLIAPYLRRFGQYTVPDFLGARYGGHLPRFIGLVAAILCSFTYLVAQIYGVGLVTTRLVGVAFEIGIFLGLGGILVCSFLGGMRGVTWTQAAQCLILLVAYLTPVVWLSMKQTGMPVPQASYGYQLQKVSELERKLTADPGERQVIEVYRAHVDELTARLQDVPAALAAERVAAERKIAHLIAADADQVVIQAAERAFAALPKDEADARRVWQADRAAFEARAHPLGGMPPHAQLYAGDANGTEQERQRYDESRRNFLALVFCLMVGTAGLPHILTRCYTTPTVSEARSSITWALGLVLVVLLAAPALAVLVKYELFSTLVGTPFDQLPAWIANWSRVDPSLVSVADMNGDGLLQLGELKLGTDILVLATPEIANLPYVISGMVAAGGLAAALSTADGLLLTIANALSHDFYYKMVDPSASTVRRVTIAKVWLLVIALSAAYAASKRPPEILFLVTAAFSLAASSFFPALTLGVFWRRANKWGAIAGMLAGFGLTLYYMVTTEPWMRSLLHIETPVELWFGIQPIAAGVFGVPLGFAVIIIVSLLTPRPDEDTDALVDRIRYPRMR